MARAAAAARCRRGRGRRRAEAELPFTPSQREQAAGSRGAWKAGTRARRVSEWAPDKIPMLRLKKMRASARRQPTGFDEISELIKRRVDSDPRDLLSLFVCRHETERGRRKETDCF